MLHFPSRKDLHFVSLTGELSLKRRGKVPKVGETSPEKSGFEPMKCGIYPR